MRPRKFSLSKFMEALSDFDICSGIQEIIDGSYQPYEIYGILEKIIQESANKGEINILKQRLLMHCLKEGKLNAKEEFWNK